MRMNPVLEWITNFLFLNLTWVLYNVPIFYLVLNFSVVENPAQSYMLLLNILILMPFLFFPSTTAMFGIARKWVMKDDVPIFRFFWKYFKENYKMSMLGGILLTLIGTILVVDYFYFKESIPFVSYVFLFFLFFWFLYTLYFCACIVHTENTLRQNLKNTFVLSIIDPFFNFGIGIICVGIVFISVKYLTFLLPFFTGALIAYVAFFGFYHVFDKLLSLTNKK